MIGVEHYRDRENVDIKVSQGVFYANPLTPFLSVEILKV